MSFGVSHFFHLRTDVDTLLGQDVLGRTLALSPSMVRVLRAGGALVPEAVRKEEGVRSDEYRGALVPMGADLGCKHSPASK